MCNGKMSCSLSAPGFAGALVVKAGGLGYLFLPRGELMLWTGLRQLVLANRHCPGRDIKCIIAKFLVDGVCNVITRSMSSNQNPYL